MKKSIIATLFAMLSLVLIPLHVISLICAIIAVIYGYQARKESNKKDGNFGFVTGIIGIAFWIIAPCVFLVQLYRWEAQGKVVEDQEYCEEIRAALTTALLDPAIKSREESMEFITYYSDGECYSLKVIFDGEVYFRNAFCEYMDVTSYEEIQEQILSEKDAEIFFCIERESESFKVSVSVQGTDLIAY